MTCLVCFIVCSAISCRQATDLLVWLLAVIEALMFLHISSIASQINNKINKYSFIKTSDKSQMNTTATTGISDAGAAPVGH